MRLRHEIFLIVAMVIWSGSWTSGKLIANSAGAELTLFWRCVFSSIALAPLVYFTGEKFVIAPRQLAWAALGGGILTVYSFLFFVGLKTGYAGAAGVLVTSMNPIFTYFLTRVIFKQRTKNASGHGATFTGRDVLGLALGLGGGVVLLEVWHLSHDQLLIGGNLFFLVCALIYAFVTITTNAATKTVSIIVYSFYINAFGALYLLPFVGRSILTTPALSDTGYWFNIIYLGVISNAFATTVYFTAVAKLGSARASSYIFIVPATALAIAAWYLGEPVKTTTVLGGLIALIAVMLLRKAALK